MSDSDSLLGGITDWAISLMETMGGPGAGIAIALENLFPPIPSEVILPLAGLAAGQGKISFFSAVIWTTIGSVVGALALYYVGVALGRDRLIALSAKLPLIKVSDIEKTETWFNEHGGRAVFFGRFIPIFRSLISIPAGLERMSLAKFLPFTAAGSLIWNTTFIYLGFVLGDNWDVIEPYMDVYSNVIVGTVVLAIVVFVTIRIRSVLRDKRSGGGPSAGGPGDSGGPGIPGPEDRGGGYYRSVHRGR